MGEENLTFKNLGEVIDSYIEEFDRIYKQSLRDNDRVASGNLINSVQLSVRHGNETISVWFDAAEYYRYIENGRKGGKWPPVNKILEWIKIKPVLPRPNAQGKLPTQKQLAYLIGRKIAREGFEGSHDIISTTEELNRKYTPLIQEALGKDMEDWFILYGFSGIDKALSVIG